MESAPKYRAALIALGSNQTSPVGPPAATLAQALGALQGESVQLVAVSRFYQTPAFPAGSGPDYVNAAASLRTSLSPDDLLQRLHDVEARFARERTGRWQARTLDIDLLGYGDEILPDRATLTDWIALSPEEQRSKAPDRLILPHPRLQDRAFVLVPLADVAPAWRHPLTGRSVAAMLDALPEQDRAEVRGI